MNNTSYNNTLATNNYTDWSINNSQSIWIYLAFSSLTVNK